MNYSKIIFPLFIVVALIQLFVPSKMILDREKILAKGKIYKFKTAPIDPTDPFRGKYITLSLAERSITVDSTEEWKHGETLYALLDIDSVGFVKLTGITKTKPSSDQDFVKAKAGYVRRYVSQSVRIEYPFERYYMEESKAYDAERYARPRRFSIDSTQVVYALVRVLDGESVLQDVMVNDQRIEDLVKEKQGERENIKQNH